MKAMSSHLFIKKVGRKMPEPLDEKYLGRKYPVAPWVRHILLHDLKKRLEDPKKGPKWVCENRERLLAEAEIIEKKRISSLSSQPIDETYLGQRLPGNPEERVELLHALVSLVQKKGEEWVWENRIRLLAEAEFIVSEKVLGQGGEIRKRWRTRVKSRMKHLRRWFTKERRE